MIDSIRFDYMNQKDIPAHIAEFPYTVEFARLDDPGEIFVWLEELYDRGLCDYGYPPQGHAGSYVFWFTEKAKAVEFKLIFGGACD